MWCLGVLWGGGRDAYFQVGGRNMEFRCTNRAHVGWRRAARLVPRIFHHNVMPVCVHGPVSARSLLSSTLAHVSKGAAKLLVAPPLRFVTAFAHSAESQRKPVAMSRRCARYLCCRRADNHSRSLRQGQHPKAWETVMAGVSIDKLDADGKSSS